MTLEGLPSDFSKESEQKKFNQLSQEEKDKIKLKAQDQASKIQEKIKTGETKKFDERDGEKDLRKERKLEELFTREFFSQRKKSKFFEDVDYFINKLEKDNSFKEHLDGYSGSIEASELSKKRQAEIKKQLEKEFATVEINEILQDFFDNHDKNYNFATHCRHSSQPFKSHVANTLYAFGTRDSYMGRGELPEPTEKLKPVVEEFMLKYFISGPKGFELNCGLRGPESDEHISINDAAQQKMELSQEDKSRLSRKGIENVETYADLFKYQDEYHGTEILDHHGIHEIDKSRSKLIEYANENLDDFQRLALFHKMAQAEGVAVFDIPYHDSPDATGLIKWEKYWGRRHGEYQDIESNPEAMALVQELKLDNYLVQSQTSSMHGQKWEMNSPAILYKAVHGEKPLLRLREAKYKKRLREIDEAMEKSSARDLFNEAKEIFVDKVENLYANFGAVEKINEFSKFNDQDKLDILSLIIDGKVIMPSKEENIAIDNDYIIITDTGFKAPEVWLAPGDHGASFGGYQEIPGDINKKVGCGSTVTDYKYMTTEIFTRNGDQVDQNIDEVLFRTTDRGIINEGYSVDIQGVKVEKNHITVELKGKTLKFNIKEK